MNAMKSFAETSALKVCLAVPMILWEVYENTASIVTMTQPTEATPRHMLEDFDFIVVRLPHLAL